MKLSHLAMMLAAALLAGCDTDAPPPHTGLPPTDPAHVMLLKAIPNRPFDELGMVTDYEVYYPPGTKATGLAIGESTDVSVKIKEKAAALGADAAIIKDHGIIDPLDSTGSTRVFVKAMAIHWKSAAPTPPDATSPPATP